MGARRKSIGAHETESGKLAELENRLDERAHQITALKRERESHLKLTIGMAVKRYSYDPRAPRNSAAKKIADDLRVTGVPLDEGTILNALRRGAELLSPED